MAIIYGTSSWDDLYSTPEADTFYGYEGNDAVFYSRNFFPGVPDPEFGTMGVYVNLTTGMGTDGFGNPETYYSIESVYGTAYADVVIGNEADNYFLLRGGGDYVDGKDGSDTITFHTDFNDVGVYVDLADETATDTFGYSMTVVSIENVRGSMRNDVIYGSEADGYMMGLAGDDILDGRGGVDTLRYDLDARYFNPLTGTQGTDGVTVNLAEGTATDGYGGTDTILNFENVIATKFDDILIGDGGGNVLLGLSGADILAGGEGADILEGGEGNDDLWGDQGSNGFAGAGYADVFVFAENSGQDTIHDFETGIDHMDLTAFAGYFELAGNELAVELPWAALNALLAHGPLATGFDLLDSNGDGVLDGSDSAITMMNGGADTLIDLGTAFGGIAGQDAILVKGVTGLDADDFLF